MSVKGNRERDRKHSPSLHGAPNITQFTLLVGNGRLAPLFLVTRKPFTDNFELDDTRIEFIAKTKVKSKDRKGEEAVLAFLEYQKSQKTFSKGDVLISDNELHSTLS
jgi:hypothetical protein